MRLYATAESVEIEQGERGFDLRVTTVDGDDFLFNIQDVALAFARSEGLGFLMEWAMPPRHVSMLEPDADGWFPLHSVRHDKWPGQ